MDYDALPPHLRPGAPVVICDRCGRETVVVQDLGRMCGLPQPDGISCGGTFRVGPR